MRPTLSEAEEREQAGPDGPADSRDDEQQRQYQEQIEKGVSEEQAAEIAADEPEPPKDS